MKKYETEITACTAGNGPDNCVEIMMEECAELIQACSKYLRLQGLGTPPRDTPKDVRGMLVEEIADVKICIEQVIRALSLDEEAINLEMAFKLKRRLNGLYKETGDEVYKDIADNLCDWKNFDDEEEKYW